MIKVISFTKGKSEDRNEDYFDYNDNSFVIADGATDKSGKKYASMTGGEIVSRLVVQESLATSLVGADLINYLNRQVYKLYKELGITREINDPKYRFSTCIVAVRVLDGQLIFTCLGDSGFRINGEDVYVELKQIDVNNAKERAKYIRETGDVMGSREHIMPLLLKQFKYQNDPIHPLGYGVIDGTKTPKKFVKLYTFPIESVRTIELFTDGYFSVPGGVSIKEWEKEFKVVEEEDPDKCLKHLSTKSKDDRTVAIIKLSN